ncbi:SusD/RagB family nutrient-binding outer membrane lipoprotein [Lunatibacter salilacus]|uniref:SusD/RagB family nutrient-binding outer membrane lipoprotein n=1 Tax=Lunatibacter salilacus TaxID=2483804 RepID=UPI00131BA02E|nr:SusD/RagB family nutrient-binding outer membrane lipoprotein [Lunatibacter salilacus]
MKKSIYNFALTLFVGTALLTSCGEFGDMNVDPNRPSSPLTSSLLTSAQRGLTAPAANSIVGDATTVLYVQHISEKQYTEASRYQTNFFDFNPMYSGPLFDLQTIIDLNSDPETSGDVLAAGSNANQIAVARILRAFYFSVITDRWGEIPYSSALLGNANFSPNYDTQRDIYLDLINELKEAVAQMDGGPVVQGDFLMEGDMERWAQFANSLRLTLALRMSEVEPQVAQTEFAAAYQAGILEADLLYPYLPETNNQNPWYARFITRVDYVASNTMVDFMEPLNDPRLGVYSDPAAETGTIVGMPYGISNAVAGEITNDEVSYLGTATREQSSELPIMTVAQLMFSLAEGAQRDWISGDAADFYNQGIEASFRQWGVFDQASYDAYIAQPEVAYNPAAAMETIHQQKWAALFLQGTESWSEWRRTGFPVLAPAVDAVNESRQIPRRHGYPVTERDLNSTNYNAAVARQGADNLDTKVWWDAD